jgi:hypothetical protein
MARMARTKRLLGCIGLLAVTLSSSGAIGFKKARGLVIPIYAGGQAEAVAAVRIEGIAEDQRRLGPFRVRALPVLVISQARVEVLQSGAASNVVAGLGRQLKQLGGRRPVEVRGFQMSFPGESAPRLQARRVTLKAEDGVLALLLEEVTLREAAGGRTLPRAWFGPGPAAPALRWGPTEAPSSYDLFAEHSEKKN